jgi:diguanylate cyclase (GGDEF)-like protein
MRTFYKKYGLLIWLFLILAIGSAALTLQTELLPAESNEQANVEQILQLTSEQVVAGLQKEMTQLEPDFSKIALTAAAREWLLNPEQDAAAIAGELQEIQKETLNKALKPTKNIYLVSTERAQSIDASGVLKSLNAQNLADAWYFKTIKNASSITQITEIDSSRRAFLQTTTSQHVLDDNGKLIGLLVVSTQSDNLKLYLEALQNKYHRLIYLIDDKGNLVFADDTTKRLRDAVLSIPGIQQIAAPLLASKKVDNQFAEFVESDSRVLLASRYIPELGLHLFLEHALEKKGVSAPPRLINFVICLGMAVLILLLVFLRLYQLNRRLAQSAATDQLTSLLNRQAFDFVFHQAMADSERSRQPLCVALIDIDLFKQVNKKNGHLMGDHILKEIAMIAKRSLRDSDVICRWGGEEFLILLKNCALEKATSIAENLRNTIANNDFSRTTDLVKKRISITVSMGVAECKINEKDDSVFERAEIALKQAKENGRNGVYFAE